MQRWGFWPWDPLHHKIKFSLRAQYLTLKYCIQIFVTQKMLVFWVIVVKCCVHLTCRHQNFKTGCIIWFLKSVFWCALFYNLGIICLSSLSNQIFVTQKSMDSIWISSLACYLNDHNITFLNFQNPYHCSYFFNLL